MACVPICHFLAYLNFVGSHFPLVKCEGSHFPLVKCEGSHFLLVKCEGAHVPYGKCESFCQLSPVTCGHLNLTLLPIDCDSLDKLLITLPLGKV